MAVRRRSLLHLVSCGLLAVAVACTKASAPGPVGVTDDWGRRVTLPAPAQRIVSLSPTTTELVFALGLGDRLVGRTTWCDYPPEAQAVPDVGNGIGPNVEALAARRPDLVLLYASEANRPALERLGSLGIPTAALRLDLADDVRRAARTIGALGGRAAAADSLVAVFDAGLAEAGRRQVAQRRARPRLYVTVQPDPPITVGRGSYLSEIVEAAGADNVFADIAGPSGPVSLEAIAARDPDAILVLAADTTREPDLDRRPGWRAVRAVRERRYVVVDGLRLFGRPSLRMPVAVRDLADRLARRGVPR